MKIPEKRKSITFRITLWISIVLVLMVIMTFMIFRIVSSSILEKTVRGYLVSSVNENIDKILFLPEDSAAMNGGDSFPGRINDDVIDSNDIRIQWQNGQLVIDDDFLDRIYDVQSALYTGDGSMLYGKNPIGRSMEDVPFTGSRVYRYRAEDGSKWFVYDRLLHAGDPETLWIRGVVPLSQEETQLADIFRTAFFFLPVLFLLGTAGSWLTAKRALQPVRRIEQTAAEITQGTDLRRRIEIGDVDAELFDLAAAFNGMLDRLEHSFETEQQFTSDASHELRTPMSVIMLQTDFALEKERTAEEYQRALSVIRRQAKRMNALIASMLDYTRLELSPENYPLEETDLSALAASAAHDMSLLRRNNISLTAEIQDHIYVQGNALLLERALQNLIDNAYKYGRDKGMITVRVLQRRDGTAVCSVSDDGTGISGEDMEHIFERFYRGDPSRSSGNTPSSEISGFGLGLSMVKKIMEIHGGSIKVESRPGTGSTFTLVFLK